MKITESADFSYPEYMDVIYEGLYDDDVLCKKADQLWRCNLRTLGCYKKLVNAVITEIHNGQRICQLGVVFGNQIEQTANMVGRTGAYDIIDINENVIKRTNNKYVTKFSQLKLKHNDAAKIKPSAVYDAVICFLLLSMVPKNHKKLIINNALGMVKPEGKVIFIDWHKPSRWNLLGWPVKMFNRLYHPFTEDLWNCSISDFTKEKKSLFTWQTNLYQQGLFQKTVAIRQSEEDPSDFMQLYL